MPFGIGLSSSELYVDAHNHMISAGEGIQHERARETILFSALFAEAFMNDLTAWINMRRGELAEGRDDRLLALADLLPQFEEDRLQIRLKYQLTYYLLNLRRLPLGTEPFQSFSLLIDLRNRLVHARPPIMVAPKGFAQAIPQQRKLMEKMCAVGAIDREEIGGSVDWTVAARSRKCPPWAFSSAAAMVSTIINSIPREDMRRQLATSVFSEHVPT
jgi:hypothetical protein